MKCILFSCTIALAAEGYAIHLILEIESKTGTTYDHKVVRKGCIILHKEYYMMDKLESQVSLNSLIINC
ncbi:hypothetical protein FOA22_09890 [Heyndrickxia oleronia]